MIRTACKLTFVCVLVFLARAGMAQSIAFWPPAPMGDETVVATFSQPFNCTAEQPTLVASSAESLTFSSTFPDGIVNCGFIPDPLPLTSSFYVALDPLPSATYAVTWNIYQAQPTGSPTLLATAASTLTIAPYAGGPAINLDQRGLSGPWANPQTDGQGLEVTVAPDFYGTGTGLLFAGWLTYDPNGTRVPVWYTLQGPVSSSSPVATIPIYLTQNGNFNAPGATYTKAVGQSLLTFSDCDHGVLSYLFTDGSGRSGTIPLTRLLPDDVCL
jgi:hypothetical protein